ncbi:MAG TPA: hypothetical protein VH740_22495 [Vicinamibacterales bacterium]|jgi:hypothetical protein
MRRHIAAVTCCLSLVHVSIAAADDTVATPATPAAVVKRAPKSGPIRNASLNRDAVMTYIGEPATAARSIQEMDEHRDSWVERHPVWTGAIVGFSAGVLLTYAATHDSDKGELLKVMSTGSAATFWGGVTAGIGALTGWAIGRNRDNE